MRRTHQARSGQLLKALGDRQPGHGQSNARMARETAARPRERRDRGDDHCRRTRGLRRGPRLPPPTPRIAWPLVSGVRLSVERWAVKPLYLPALFERRPSLFTKIAVWLWLFIARGLFCCVSAGRAGLSSSGARTDTVARPPAQGSGVRHRRVSADGHEWRAAAARIRMP